MTGDDELRGFLAAEAASACYWLLQFTCTFDHDDELPFAKTWLQLALASDGGTAVAHSMEPAKLTGNRVVTCSAKLTIPCVFAQLEFGGDGQVTTEEVSCEASYEGTAKPTWRYFKTSSAAIRDPADAPDRADSGMRRAVGDGPRRRHCRARAFRTQAAEL